MFAIDYEASFIDHKRVTVCLALLGPGSDEETFDSVFCSLVTHYSLTFVRSNGSKSEHLLGTDKRNSLSETSEVHSDIGISNFSTRQPVWLRFLKEYNPINNAWSCFQPYRATVGLLAFAWCSSHSDIELRIKDYIKQKKLLSATLISGRLFLLLRPLSNENDSLSVEEANAFISEKLREDSELLGEINCHPSEHLFASEMNILKDFGYSAGTDECSSLVDKSHASIRPPFVNHRISSLLQALTSEIYWNLKKMLAAKCPSDIKLKKKESQLSKDLTDSSDNLLMAPEENESKWNILDEVRRKALGRTNALSALSAFTDRAGSTSSISAQTDISFEWFGFIKQKRATGRFKKYLGDICLQLGDLEMAQIQYNLAIEHLKPINDTLWIAGALEGLCAVAMCQHSSDHSSNLGTTRSKFLQQRYLDDNLTDGELRKSQFQESDMLEHSTSSSLDLASSKFYHPLVISSTDCCNYALETIELYQKAELNPYLFEEFKFKVIRLLISESQKRKACEILDSLVGPSLSSFSTENPCSMKRYFTIVRLYKFMNFNRKASLALWLLLSSNRLDRVEFEHEILFNGLKIQSLSSNIAQMTETKLLNSNDDTTTNTINTTITNSNNITNNKDISYLLNENKPPVIITCRLIASPPLWCPFVVPDQSHWLIRLITTISNSSMLSTSIFNNIIKLKSMFNNTRHLNSNMNSNINSLYSSKSCLPFRLVGWCDLQLKVIFYLINEYKAKINLEDISEIPWDIGLKLIGYCFSVLDSWPEYLDKNSCISCMDDLCCLAVLRCPDQPTNLPSITLLNYSTQEDVRSRRWPRNLRVVYSPNGFCHLMNNSNEEVQTKVVEKKMLDLVEIPVHQLPLVRLINIPSLPSNLLPHTISKNGAENVVSLSRIRTVVIRSDRHQSKPPESNNNIEPSKSTDPFVYNPFQMDNSGGTKHSIIDWICEEPGYIEMIVDNKLPIDLRISDLHVELMPVNIGLSTKETSSNRVSSLTSDYESSFGGGGSTVNNECSDAPLNLIHLEAISLTVETPQSVKILPTSSLSNLDLGNVKHQTKESGFYGRLESGCLLEEAELHRQFPYSNTECFWRRVNSDVNCKLPSHTNGIKLSIGVVPTLDLLTSSTSFDDSNTCLQYRVVGITYRLVDCGGMRVCLRPSGKFLYSLSSFGESSSRGRERHPSGSSSSTFSTIRSSWNLGSEAICPNGISNISEFDNEHLLSNSLGIQFSLLPLIRLQPAMPRMCMFPGRICSAFDLHEAIDILRNESTCKHSCDVAKQLHSLGLSKFQVPDPLKWCNRVAAVLDLTIFPYETRWLPIELYIRDENRFNVSINNNNPESNYDFDGNYSIKRNLNLLHVNLKSVSSSLSLLTKLNLNATDFVQCIGLEDIRKRFPLPVENCEVPNSLPNMNSDYDEHSLPLYATHVGLIWLKFDSDKYWQIVTDRFSSDPEINELMKPTQVQPIYIELEIEYAVDATKSSPSSECNTSSSPLLFSNNQSLTRQISLGFKLELLASNLAPLKLSDLMLTFEDEPSTNEYYLPKNKQMIKLFGEKIQAESFLCGSVETDLSHTFLPQILIEPDHLLHYRLEIELEENWSNQQQSKSPVQLISPWLFHVSCEPTDNSSKRKKSLSSTELSKTVSEKTSNSSSSPVLNSCADVLDNLKSTHQIRLPLIGFSDLVFSSKMTKLINSERLKSNELGIPIPVKIEVPGSVLESNIKIFWYSRVLARWKSDCRSEKSQQYENLYLCSYFRRYGRIILSAHECQIDPKWFANETLSTSLFKPWYEYPFLNSGSTAGLLWSNNIWIDISLDPPILDYSSNFRVNSQKKLDPQSQLCLQCRQDYSIARRTTVCTQRRISSISMLLNQELLTNTNTNITNTIAKSQLNNLKIEQSPVGFRKISLPDLRVSQKSIMSINKEDLYSSSRICTYPLNPVSVSIQCGVRQSFLRNIFMENEANPTTQRKNSFLNSKDTTDSTQEFRIEHVWMGPAVYRHVQHISNDDYESTQSTLLGPLIEGMDYTFVGKASGSIGFSIPQCSPSSSLSTSSQKSETSISSIIFLRPGKFWVCGLLGILPESSILTITKDGHIPTPFHLPSAHSVETIRFSPNGIYIHVLDSHI
uniref:Trs120/TRAPPC9 N-terminal domain-containing protein n=1 Tax=Schistosoma mansoni TaxID=6183 RepID=A0A5K4E984_SCHMA